MNLKEIKEVLGTDNIRTIKGVFRYHRSYFYGGFTKSGENLKDYILSKIPNAKIEDYGNHYHNFVGGASSGSAKDSFLWCTFTVPNESKPIHKGNCGECLMSRVEIIRLDDNNKCPKCNIQY